MNDDELTHAVKQLVQQQSGQYRPFVYGHVSTYDPKAHRAKVIYPSLSTTGVNFVESAWMPVNSPWASSGAGIQYVLRGGATTTEPTAGEQCLVGMLDHRRGTGVILALLFNNNAQPPGASQNLDGGDLVIQSTSGSALVVKGDGSLLSISDAAAVVISANTSAKISVGSISAEITDSKISLNGDTYVSGTLYVNGVQVTVP